MFDDYFRTRLLILSSEDAPAEDSSVWADTLVRTPAEVAAGVLVGGFGGAFFSALVAHGFASPAHGVMVDSIVDALAAESASDEDVGPVGDAASRISGSGLDVQDVTGTGDELTRAVGEAGPSVEDGASTDGRATAPTAEAVSGALIGAVGDSSGYAADLDQYLQFNGTTHFAHAEGAFGAISGTYTVAVKVAGGMRDGGSGGGGGTYFSTGGPGPDAMTQSGYDLHLRLGSTGRVSYLYAQRPDTGANLYSFSTGYSIQPGRHVLAVKRLSGGTAKNRIINSAGVQYSNDRAAALVGVPTRLVIGARISNALALHTQPGPVSWISAIVVDGEVSDADLQAWCAGTLSAMSMPGVVGYWEAADVSGGVVPARIGSDMTLVGVSAANLVRQGPGWALGAGFDEDAGVVGDGASRIQCNGTDSLSNGLAANAQEVAQADATSAAIDGVSADSSVRATAGSDVAQSEGVQGDTVAHVTAGSEVRESLASSADAAAPVMQSTALVDVMAGAVSGLTVDPVAGSGSTSIDNTTSSGAQVSPLSSEAAESTTIGVLSDDTAPPWAGDSFVDLLVFTGVSVFGDMLVVADGAGFAELADQIGVYGDAKWAAWAAHAYLTARFEARPILLRAALPSELRLDVEVTSEVSMRVVFPRDVTLKVDI